MLDLKPSYVLRRGILRVVHVMHNKFSASVVVGVDDPSSLQQVVKAYSMALVCYRESNCTGRRKFSWSSNCSGSGVASCGRRLPCLHAWSECD